MWKVSRNKVNHLQIAHPAILLTGHIRPNSDSSIVPVIGLHYGYVEVRSPIFTNLSQIENRHISL